MATTSKCAVCRSDKFVFPCQGCSKGFCIDHLAKHRTDLGEQLDQIENDHGKIDQDLIEHNNDLKKHPVILYIDQWEKESIEKIKQTAERCRKQWGIYSTGLFLEVEGKLNDLAKEIRKARDGNAFHEIHLNRLKKNLETIQKEFNQPTDVYIEEQETLFLDKIALRLPLRRGRIDRCSPMIDLFSSRCSMGSTGNDHCRKEWSWTSIGSTLCTIWYLY